MALPSGTALLDGDGNFILDSDGNRILSDGTHDCECCWRYLVPCEGDGPDIAVREANVWSGAFSYGGTCYSGLDSPVPREPAVEITHDDVTDEPDCGTCEGGPAPCTGEGDCDTLHVAFYDGISDTPICEVDLIKTGPCSWNNPDASTTDCGGSNFVISSMFYDTFTGLWTLQMAGLGGDVGFVMTNPGGDPDHIPLDRYRRDGDDFSYALVSCVGAGRAMGLRRLAGRIKSGLVKLRRLIPWPGRKATPPRSAKSTHASALDKGTKALPRKWWPRWALSLRAVAAAADVGLGDTAAREIAALGVPKFQAKYGVTFGPECACDAREWNKETHAKWNAKFPRNSKSI